MGSEETFPPSGWVENLANVAPRKGLLRDPQRVPIPNESFLVALLEEGKLLPHTDLYNILLGVGGEGAI